MGIPIIPVPFWFDRKLKRLPVVTLTIIGICVLVYLAFWVGQALQPSADDQGRFVMGYVETMTFAYGDPRPFGLIAHAFTHVSFMHLLSNMLILWVVGSVLEESLGPVVFILFYLASLVMAVLINGLITLHFMTGQMDARNLGASGAIAGVMGLAAFRNYRLKVNTLPVFGFPLAVFPGLLLLPVWRPVLIPYWCYAAYFAVKEVWSGVSVVGESLAQGYTTSSVAHWAHNGGLLMGIIAAVLLNSVREGKRDYTVEDAERAAHGEVSPYATQLDLEALLRQRPNDPELLRALAKVHAAQGQYVAARDCYGRALAACVAGRDDARLAETYIALLMTLPPTAFAPELQLAIAERLEAQGRYEEATEAYDTLIAHDPHSAEAPRALLNGALVYLRRRRDPIRAEWMLRTLVTEYPDASQARTARETLGRMDIRL